MQLYRLKFTVYHLGRMMHADFRDADYSKFIQKPNNRKDESIPSTLWNQAIEEAVAEYNQLRPAGENIRKNTFTSGMKSILRGKSVSGLSERAQSVLQMW